MASVEHMLNYLLTEVSDQALSAWEAEFLDSLSELEEEVKLTPLQLAKLKEIYDAH